MPSAIAGATKILVALGVNAAVAEFVAYVGLNVLLSAAADRLFGKTQPTIGIAGHQVTTRGALEYRKVIYGQASVSGPIIYNNVSGSENEYLWFQVAMTDHECEDLVSVWLEGDEIPAADIDWSPGASGADGTGSGDVSTSKWTANGQNAVSVFYYPGHADQVVSGDLNSAFSDIDTNHRCRGVAHVIFRFLYNADTEEVWRNGVPQNMKAVWQGRQIYDPRLDSTNGGSGSHRYATPSTWEWSENPALCVADYLMTYMGADPDTSIDWTSVADAADDCEVTVNLPASGTEDRFTCNGVLSLGDSHRNNLKALLTAMDGKLTYSSGQWRVRASVWESSSVSINADDLAGPVSIRGSAPKSERFNTVRGFFADPDRDYVLSEFPHVFDSTYITRDNGETITLDTELPFTNTATMAQRLGMRTLEQSDNQIACTLQLNAMGAKIAPGDVVDVTLDEFSWSAKTFRVIEWKRNPGSSSEPPTYSVVLKEDDSAAYTDPVPGDYSSQLGGSITPPSVVVPAPSGLTASSASYGIKLTWTNPAFYEFDFIDIYESSSSAWSGATKIASVSADNKDVSHTSGESYYYWIRARRSSGDVSDRFPNSDTSTITATSSGDAQPVQLKGANLSDIVDQPTNAEVSYQINSNGDEETYEGVSPGTYGTIGTWLLEGTNSDYDVRCTVNSGDNPTSGSSINTWLSCGTTRNWTLRESTNGAAVSSNDCTIEIRLNSSGDVLASAPLDQLARTLP